MNLMLQGCTAVVTGGGKGIGAGICKRLAVEGVQVLINCNSNQEMAEKTAAQIQDAGGSAVVYRADVGDRVQVNTMMAKAAELFGGIDILVNNAAWQPNLDIDEYTEEFYDSIMNINLGGYFRCMQSALPYLKQSRCARVINISSIHAKRPGDFDVCYSMTKGAIKMLTREAALELAEYGITVNAVLPGAVRIEFKSGYTAPFKQKRVKRERTYSYFPLKRIAIPDDVADLVVFLASGSS
jgi:glucose 1-dehydrogenase